MKIAGLAMTDAWAHRLLSERGVDVDVVEAAPGEMKVLVDSVQLHHHGPEQKYRPYLHISGEVRSVLPAQPFSHGVDEVEFARGAGDVVDGYYEFTDQQLMDLLAKGYFNQGFVVPEQVIGLEWELPCTLDATIIAPAGDNVRLSEQEAEAAPDVPLVFLRIRNIADLKLDLYNSEYDLASYFADFSHDGGERFALQEERQAQSESARTRVLPTVMFDVDEVLGSEAVLGDTESVENVEGLAAQIIEAEAALSRDELLHRDERVQTEGTIENVYQHRVANVVAEREAAVTHEPVPVVEPTVTVREPEPAPTPVDEPAVIVSDTEVEVVETLVQAGHSPTDARRTFEEMRERALRRGEEVAQQGENEASGLEH